MMIRAIWKGTIIAETSNFILLGGNYYFPPESINSSCIEESSHTTSCPWKGTANYIHINVKNNKNENAAWIYKNPKKEYEHIKGYYSFWNGVEITQKKLQRKMNTNKNFSQNQLDFILNVPKTEIHIHLEAIASVDSIYKLLEKNNISLEGIHSWDDLYKRFQVKDLDDFVDLYINVLQPCIQDENDFNYYLNDLKQYLIRNNIYYAEVFFSPSAFLKSGLEYGKILDVIEAKVIELEEDGFKVRFLVDVSRSFGAENAMKNLDLVLSNKSRSIIGIGLGGAESKGPARDYIDVFKKARENGLHVVAHAGEDVGPKSIWDAIKLLKVERIGHGISSVLDEKLMKYIKDNKIPLEICPTSNIFTKKFVSMLDHHPIREFFDYGMNVTLNTDDPTIFGVELVDEYANLIQHLNFSIDEIIQLIKNNLMAAFMADPEKNENWERIKLVINDLRKKYNV